LLGEEGLIERRRPAGHGDTVVPVHLDGLAGTKASRTTAWKPHRSMVTEVVGPAMWQRKGDRPESGVAQLGAPVRGRGRRQGACRQCA